MRLHSVVVLLAIGISVAACQTVQGTYSLSPTDTAYQAVRLNPKTHTRFVISRRQHSVVAFSLSPETSWKDYGTTFSIKVKNAGKKPVVFGAHNIEVSSAGQKSEVLDYAGIRRAIVQGQNGKEAAATFAAIAGGLGAGLYAGSPNANPYLASAITQEVTASVQASSARLANSQAEADVLLTQEDSKAFITTQIIPPSGVYGGVVVVTPIGGSTAEVTVTVGNDHHVFSIASQ